MSTRRQPKKYRDGGRVLADTPIPGDEPAEAASMPAREPMPGDDALVRAAENARRAEEIQRAAVTAAHEQRIVALDIPDTGKDWLRSHPEYVTDAGMNQQIGVMHNYLRSIKGIEPFSPAYFGALDEMHSEVAHRRELMAASARPTPENFEIQQNANDLAREAMEAAAEIIPQPAPAPPPQPHKSMPISAPVSREAPMPSGQRESSTRIRLSAEERDIAHKSRRDLSPLDAEILYAKNKRLMIERKASGEIQGG